MNYIDHIVESINGSESVLDIGTVGKSLNRGNLKRFDAFRKASKNIIGIDNRRERVEFARHIGYKEIFLSDITNEDDVINILRKHGTFNHIILTDVVEHIGNLTVAFDNIYRLMNGSSLLYISTPNVASSFFHNRFREIREKTFELKPEQDHVCWFCENTLTTLLERSSLVPVFVQEADQQILFFIVKKK